MPNTPTPAQLMELGKKAFEVHQRQAIKDKAIRTALYQLKRAHQSEYQKYLAESLEDLEGAR